MNTKRIMKIVRPLFALLAISALFYAVPSFSQDDFIGKKAPKLEVEKWLSAQPDTSGKYMVVDFWATWCGPCVKMIPHMNELNAELQDDFVFIALSNENEATVRSFKRANIEYFSAIDTQSRLASFFQINSIPHVVVIAPDGTVAWKGHPAYLNTDTLEALKANKA